MSLKSHGGMILTGGNGRTRRKTCSSSTLTTSHFTEVSHTVLMAEWSRMPGNFGVVGSVLHGALRPPPPTNVKIGNNFDITRAV
jgi:hypothetical protein